MAIAMFNDQETLAGQKLGISTGKALGLIIMAAGLAAMNIYHMGNAVTSKLLTPDSSIFAYALLYFIACCIAFMEVPVTEEIVTQEARGRKAKGHRLMLGVIVTMAIGAGLYSITSDADKRASTVTAHETAELSYQDRAQALISDRNIARSKAENSAGVSQANADYYRALAALRLEQSGHQSTRPALAVKTDSIFHWIWAIGFSLLCSLGVVVITAYLTKYHKPLTEIPRVFFKVREEQNWQMNDDDVRVIPANVDLTGSSSTKAARKAITRPAQSKAAKTNKDSSGDTENRPAPTTTTLGAVSNTENAPRVRTREEGVKPSTKNYYEQSHYESIKLSIIKGEIKPTIKPLKEKLEALNVTFINDTERQEKAYKIRAQLLEDGVIINNPDYGKTGLVVAEYILNPEYFEYQKEEEQGTNDLHKGEQVYTTCPSCGNESSISREVADKHKGAVKCSCDHVYNIYDHLTT